MKKIFVIFSLITIFVSKSGNAQIEPPPFNPLIAQMCVEVNKDSLKWFVRQLQSFGTRDCRAPNKKIVAEWIRGQFIRFGYLNAYLDSFYVNSTLGWQYNVVASLFGTDKPDSIYILGGHHDCTTSQYLTNAPGADDNASGTAATLEIARIFKKTNYLPRGTIRFMTFAAEEQGLYGSASYAQRAKQQNIRIQMMLNNDMISFCQDTINNWKVNLTYYNNSAVVTDLADSCRSKYSTLGVLRTTSYNNASDSYSFYQQGFKTVFFIENQFSTYYHTINDTVGACNYKFAAEITKINVAMILSENGTAKAVSVDESITALYDYVLHPNYPNPFNPSTTIHYRIKDNERVSLKIYNTLGQEVRTLVNAAQTAGEHSVQWDGRDNQGTAVSSGIYIYRLQAGNFIKSNKMTLMR